MNLTHKACREANHAVTTDWLAAAELRDICLSPNDSITARQAYADALVAVQESEIVRKAACLVPTNERKETPQ